MYRSLQQCVEDLESQGHLVRLSDPVDPDLEVAEIHRRVFAAGGPAVLYENATGCDFPLVSNLFGKMDRVHFLFRKTLDSVRRLIELKIDPTRSVRDPIRYGWSGLHALRMLPRKARHGAVFDVTTSLPALPKVTSWPMDGGAFITLPQVYTEDLRKPGLMGSNLGMYRVQLDGNQYDPQRQVGLHYQIHRGIGIHHAAAKSAGQPLKVNIFVGGTPAMTVASVMPLPEGLSELTFAGALAGHRIPMVVTGEGPAVYADADFCIQGTIEPDLMPEGPFGDHLGYYALKHDFPALRVHRVTHRRGAIWPVTVVGRPPQEDSYFGELIHELTGPLIPTVVHGVRAVNAVDAAGVHPLMLAIGSERYQPYAERLQPQEVLTQANAILGQGQMSLAKYLLIVAEDDDPDLSVTDAMAFFRHVLSRIDWKRDLHFQTCTTMDTLDYSSRELNEGSKVVWAAVGPVSRQLGSEVPTGLRSLAGFGSARVVAPGILAVSSPPAGNEAYRDDVRRFCDQQPAELAAAFPLVILVDDSEFAARAFDNFLWSTFTRSDPAVDIDGVGAFVQDKHWGCTGSLVIDARVKPHHAPQLTEDPEVSARVDALAARGGPLSRWL
ncbi:MAG: UbiD family decarboxylase [Planctomycetota bacterium]